MWQGCILVVLLSAILVVAFYSLAGARARKNPAIFVSLGFLATSLAAVVYSVSQEYFRVAQPICHLFGDENCINLIIVDEISKKIIEFGLGALGISLVTLGIDIRSERALKKKTTRVTEEQEKSKERLKKWHDDFVEFGQQLDNLGKKEMVEGFFRLRESYARIQDEFEKTDEDFKKWTAE